MELAKVIGTVVSTRKDDGMEGVKLLLIQPLDHKLNKTSDPIVACDCVEAGIGELVHFVAGREATIPLPVPFVPVDATIVGIVDEVNV